MTALPTVILGRTGRRVSRLAFGGASLAQLADGPAEKLIRAALAAGVTLFDAAQCYGRAEEHLGRVLAPHRDRVCLITKVGHHEVLPGGRLRSRKIGAADVDLALRRLRTDHLDALLLHSYDPAEARLTAAFDVLRAARKAGKVRAIGYSGDNAAARAALTLAPDLDVLELTVNVADQGNLTSLLPAAAARNLGVLAKRALANAAWRHLGQPPTRWADNHEAPYVRRLAAMQAVAERAPDGAPWDESALRFVLATPGVHVALVGASKPENLLRNARLVAQLGALPPDPALHAAWRRRFAAAESMSPNAPWPALN